MRKLIPMLCVVAVASAFSSAQATEAADAELIKAGKELVFNQKKGNCLACHVMDDGELPGNAGPALQSMKLRYPDKARLRAQIWDPTQLNPYTIMPPFGRHHILSEDEIDKVVEYIHSL